MNGICILPSMHRGQSRFLDSWLELGRHTYEYYWFSTHTTAFNEQLEPTEYLADQGVLTPSLAYPPTPPPTPTAQNFLSCFSGKSGKIVCWRSRWMVDALSYGNPGSALGPLNARNVLLPPANEVQKGNMFTRRGGVSVWCHFVWLERGFCLCERVGVSVMGGGGVSVKRGSS